MSEAKLMNAAWEFAGLTPVQQYSARLESLNGFAEELRKLHLHLSYLRGLWLGNPHGRQSLLPRIARLRGRLRDGYQLLSDLAAEIRT